MTPRLETPRLILRPPTHEDADDVQRLVGDWEVARTLARVPHPYEDGMAEAWIESVATSFDGGTGFVFALERRCDHAFLGVVGMQRNDGGAYALGYWLGRPYWNQGYMSEAADYAVRYAFEHAGVDRIVASALPDNLASMAILKRLGMREVGREVVDVPARRQRREVVRFALQRKDFEVHG